MFEKLLFDKSYFKYSIIVIILKSERNVSNNKYICYLQLITINSLKTSVVNELY